MKKITTVLLTMAVSLAAATSAAAPTGRKSSPRTINRSAPAAAAATARSAANTPANQLTQALALVRQGNCLQASPMLYSLSRRPEFATERMQIKYILGSCLMGLKLNQISAFQFVDVVRRGDSKYVRQSLEKLSIAADQLGDDTLLNYAISKVRVDEFPNDQKDIVYFRLGEIKLKNNEAPAAAQLFAQVPPNSRYHAAALYKRGLSDLESNHVSEAIKSFNELLASRNGAPVTDPTRVQALIALARSYYQAQDWEKSLEYYREIPRDSELWHDSVFESTWANLRAAKFRSTLGLLQTIHSSFYEDYYVPESLLVRSIVYLYICKFEETEKTLNLFEKTYQPAADSIGRFVETIRDPNYYFAEIEKAYSIRREKKPITGLKLPYMIARQVLEEGDVKRAFSYIRALNEERLRLESYGPIARSPLGVYALKVLANRYKNTKITIGEMARAHLIALKTDIRELFEQASFIRYETINGQKESLKKKIAEKEVETQIDDQIDRTFYVQNGYEYWPFDGEYWIDELGNYHYLGKQSCK
ncbi:MAG: hypothetical protein C5B49_08295 [Bdellovibrio sp.]|nr:MAG: hypothetical protein C5B49_08295 [Bdellovibrio sp.]